MSDKVGITAVQWQKIFNDHNLLERINRDGVVEISAKLIRKYREARLMAKFDHANNEKDDKAGNTRNKCAQLCARRVAG